LNGVVRGTMMATFVNDGTATTAARATPATT